MIINLWGCSMATKSVKTHIETNQNFLHESYWSDKWQDCIEAYLKAAPRCGYWIASQFSQNLSVLEIAGGSCRDSRYLASCGWQATGSDFDQKTLDYLRKKYPHSHHHMQREDAFSLSFADQSIDLTFSNGFWVCFSDNEKIYALIREQARVTKKYLVVLVHNAENSLLRRIFHKKAQLDPIYNIRFFTRVQLRQLIENSDIHYRSLRFCKFGGPADKLLFKRELTKSLVPKLYSYQPWCLAERIACIIELEH